MSSSSVPGILIADDHALVAEGIRCMLEPEYEVKSVVFDGRALVEQAIAMEPELIITDVSMPLLNGFEAARRITSTLFQSRIVFLTMHSDPDYVRAAFEAGAAGYALKRSD